MWIQFLLENLHFAINIFVALIFFAVYWLYLDAWKQRKTFLGGVRSWAYLLLSLSFVVQSAVIESTIVSVPFFGPELLMTIVSALRIFAYLLLIGSLVADPLVPRPSAGAFVALAGVPLIVSYPLLAVIVGFLYLRRATVGLEHHLKSVAYAFFFLALSEWVSLASLFRQSTNIGIYSFVAPFGIPWVVEHVFLLLTGIIVGRWVFGYLFAQFHTQLFMIITTITIGIFLVTTVSFTGLLVKNVQDQTIAELGTDVHVLSYTIEGKKLEAIADAQLIAQNAQVISAVTAGSKTHLADIAEQFLLTKKQTTLVITNTSGIVLARGEDRTRLGDSVSDDIVVKRALLGETVSSLISRDGVVAPQIDVRAAVPVHNGTEIVGIVLVGSAIDTAFVDGVHKETGLTSTIYGDNRVSASSLTTQDGATRIVGLRMEDPRVKKIVLGDGHEYAGLVSVADIPYVGSFLPLKDLDGVPLGMLFVGSPQTTVLASAGRSIELTFLVTIVLIVCSVIPAYAISRYIAYQIE